MTDLIAVDPNLKILIDANSNALAALLNKIVSGDTNVTEEIARVSATDSDLRSAVSGDPAAPLDSAPAA